VDSDEPSLTVRGSGDVLEAYRAHLERVFGYLLYRTLGDRMLAEELTQEVFVAYATAVSRGRAIRDTQGWLISVARNKLVDRIRRDARPPRSLHSRVETDDTTIVDGALAAIELLRGLPTMQRTAIVLRYVDDLPVAEVANLLGKSLRATESLLARGRTNLARRLA
jgi:RNA polymerase sigma-70 factor (ECF subfamily)